MKEVNWQIDFGGVYLPFCPHCGEPVIYKKEQCVFCGKKYKWVECKHKPTVIEVGEYTIIQSTNNNIIIYKNTVPIKHIAYTEKLSKKELINLAMKEND